VIRLARCSPKAPSNRPKNAHQFLAAWPAAEVRNRDNRARRILAGLRRHPGYYDILALTPDGEIFGKQPAKRGGPRGLRDFRAHARPRVLLGRLTRPARRAGLGLAGHGAGQQRPQLAWWWSRKTAGPSRGPSPRGFVLRFVHPGRPAPADRNQEKIMGRPNPVGDHLQLFQDCRTATRAPAPRQGRDGLERNLRVQEAALGGGPTHPTCGRASQQAVFARPRKAPLHTWPSSP
jgi:hypothetical protein